MGFIVFGIVMAIILVIVFAVWASQDCEWHNTFAAILAFLLGIPAAITVICFCFIVWSWNASEYKANIINREYGTSYSREEIFYGSDVIETIRQLDRTRMEINGNILRDKE
jgi:RsiW-degrading membrane proteinase PrsW (M82 family)